jgi:hypothetical protein
MRTPALLLLFALTASTATAATDRQTLRFALPAARALALDITIGKVRVEGSDRTDAEVLIERTAPSAEAMTRIPVVVDESPERVTIKIVQLENGTDARFTSDVVIRVPDGVTIERVHIMEGRLEIQRFRGALTADVRRGPIEGMDLSGTLRLETGIGSVVLRNARLAPDGLLRLRAFNGDVRLQMPAPPADARVLALALNGTIQSDILMTTRDTWGPRWSEATLGKGEPVISIDVVTGKVEIRTR